MRTRILVGAAVLAVGAGVFVAIWFQPQKLVIDKTVSEPAATAPASVAPDATPAEPSVLGRGEFRALEHPTTGTAILQRLPDGAHVLRFEALDTSNGPDLRVYLSERPSTLGWRDYGEEFVDLGALKGNRGDQNYEIPAHVDVTQYRSAVVWCRRFTVGFGVAPLD